MQYLKLTSGNTIIEFHNNWLGEETVTVNGKMVSKKSSVYGAQHYFDVAENGIMVHYILSSKIIGNMMEVGLDLIRDGEPVYQNIPLPYGNKPKTPGNDAKKLGLAKMKEYNVDDALLAFKKALNFDAKDPEIYFNLACIYSNKENVEDGFECLKKAVELGLDDHSAILTHDWLAYLRIQDIFNDFEKSGFTNFKIKKLKKVVRNK